MKELQVFVSSNHYEKVASEVGLYFGVEGFLENKKSDDPTEFYVVDLAVGLQLYHAFENDRDLDFSNYQILITLRALNFKSKIRSYDDMFESIARYLAEKVSSVLSCKTMVVQDVQLRLANFDSGNSTYAHKSNK